MTRDRRAPSSTDHDPVDAVVLAFLDYREGRGPRPLLADLSAADRRRAEELMSGLATARGIDPRATRPSVEALLADTPLAGLLTDVPAALTPELAAVVRVLEGVDPRAFVDVEAGTVTYSYLDLRARFLLIPARTAAVTNAVRAQVAAVFAADPDTSRVGVVAGRGEDLMTQMLAPDDLGAITTPRGEPHTRWEAPLPLALAARRMLEQSAPEWPAFDFDHARAEPLDVPSLAAEIARRVIERESGRSYRGDKRRAYQALAGSEGAFADLVAAVSTRGSTVDLDAETAHLWREAA
jgi:hypothetical protein